MTKVVALWGRDDFNTGTTVNDAFRSIQAALNNTVTNEFVDIYAGNYIEALFSALNTVYLNGQGIVSIYPPTPNAYFLDYFGKSLELYSIHLIDFTNTIRVNNGNGTRPISFTDCKLLSSTRGTIENIAPSESLQIRFQASFSAFICYDLINIDVEIIENSTFHDCHLQFRYNNFGSGYIQDSIITASHCEFTNKVVVIRNVLFGDQTTFSYDDGLNSVSNVDFATFQTANETHEWGFDLSNCIVESEAAIYQDSAANDFAIQSSSLAVGAALNGGVVGAFPVSERVLATDTGWQNNAGFTLNMDQYEATGVAEITSPVIDLQINKPIQGVGGLLFDAWQDGRLFNDGGNLGTPIVSGASQSGLSVALTPDAVYCVDGFVEVTTNLRGLTFTNQQCFTAFTGETITAVTAAGAGEIREVLRLDGNTTMLAKWWKDGESEPANWSAIYREKTLLVDSQGNTNAEPAFDENDFPRHPVGRFVKVKAVVSTNNVKS
ncbi:MAG: hypothetical protein ACPGJS_00530 [Flammeovirgaceae bacterium]